MYEKKNFILHYDSLSVIDKMSDEQVGQLLRKMKSYHEWNDYKTSDFVVDIAFEHFKNQFDREKKKQETIKKARSQAGKLWWRPKKQNKAKKANAFLEKQNKAKKANAFLEDVKKNNMENTDILTVIEKDNKTKNEYWNHEINKCIEMITHHNNWIIDWTTKKNRMYANHLIKKIKKTKSVECWKFERYEYLLWLLEAVKWNKYYSSRTNSPESIYRNLAVLQGVANTKHKEQTEPIIQNFNFKTI